MHTGRVAAAAVARAPSVAGDRKSKASRLGPRGRALHGAGSRGHRGCAASSPRRAVFRRVCLRLRFPLTCPTGIPAPCEPNAETTGQRRGVARPRPWAPWEPGSWHGVLYPKPRSPRPKRRRRPPQGTMGVEGSQQSRRCQLRPSSQVANGAPDGDGWREVSHGSRQGWQAGWLAGGLAGCRAPVLTPQAASE